MIKALIFDFGKVLVDYDFSHIIDPLFDNEADRKEFNTFFTSLDFINELDREVTPFIDIIRRKQKEYPKYTMQLQTFYDRYVDFVTGEVPGMKGLLKDLKAQGFKLYGLTNWSSKVHQVMKYYDIFDLLDGQVISSDEHLIKPEPEIYERLLEKYGLKAEECVFTDDKAINVVAAEKVGIRGIVFQDAAQYASELKVIIEQKA
ncbi:MAG: HAD family phosphatase [Bacteroidales bacterium]|nr:HAD family phosphatase [Bacteroidales bacterium]